MIKHTLTFPPSPTTQTILETGAGRALRITLAHNLPTRQVVVFYDRDDRLIKEFEMFPLELPYTLTFANRESFAFDNGLKVNTGNCKVDLLIAY
jgi:hypothetical protein